jgi:hypothetical protein
MPHCSTDDDGRFAKIFISKISMKTLVGKYPRVSIQALSNKTTIGPGAHLLIKQRARANGS